MVLQSKYRNLQKNNYNYLLPGYTLLVLVGGSVMAVQKRMKVP